MKIRRIFLCNNAADEDRKHRLSKNSYKNYIRIFHNKT